MIGPTGPVPNLLRQYELGAVPKEMSDEHDAVEPHDGHAGEHGEEKKRRWWRRLLRRH